MVGHELAAAELGAGWALSGVVRSQQTGLALDEIQMQGDVNGGRPAFLEYLLEAVREMKLDHRAGR